MRRLILGLTKGCLDLRVKRWLGMFVFESQLVLRIERSLALGRNGLVFELQGVLFIILQILRVNNSIAEADFDNVWRHIFHWCSVAF